MKKILTLLILSILLTSCGDVENKKDTDISIEKGSTEETLTENEIDNAINEIFTDLEK